MKKIMLLALAMPFIFLLQSCLDSKRAKNYNQETQVDAGGIDFIKRGLEGGLTEIKASTVAITHSQNPRVISFAKMMVDDHDEAGVELNKIRIKEDVSPVDTINVDHKQMINRLKALSGPPFDKAYMKMMIDDHVKTIKLYSVGGEDRTNVVQTFAKKTLPTLHMHLDSAQAINSSLK